MEDNNFLNIDTELIKGANSRLLVKKSIMNTLLTNSLKYCKDNLNNEKANVTLVQYFIKFSVDEKQNRTETDNIRIITDLIVTHDSEAIMDKEVFFNYFVPEYLISLMNPNDIRYERLKKIVDENREKHVNNNKHHPEYWCNTLKSNNLSDVMPIEYIYEYIVSNYAEILMLQIVDKIKKELLDYEIIDTIFIKDKYIINNSLLELMKNEINIMKPDTDQYNEIKDIINKCGCF